MRDVRPGYAGVRGFWTALALCLSLIAGGCSSTGPFDDWTRTQSIPPASSSGVHVVRRGDTLYSIAVANNTDYRALARWNGIRDPGRIYVGQRIRLTPPSGSAPVQAATPKRPDPAPPATSKPRPKPAAEPPKPKPPSGAPFAWQWP
ncbi:MAG: LysM peptidoglycan-binding domain-containing protein, partial [Halothiobacillaceae bacterium]